MYHRYLFIFSTVACIYLPVSTFGAAPNCRAFPAADAHFAVETQVLRSRDSDYYNPSDVILTYRSGELEVGTQYFNQTNRGYEWFARYFPKEVYSLENLRGKKALDVGTGGGAWVIDTALEGVDSYGVDVHLPLDIRDATQLYSSMKDKNSPFWHRYGWHQYGNKTSAFSTQRFFEHSFTDLPFPNGNFDLVIATVVFHYEMPIQIAERGLYEMARVTKPGGAMLIHQLRQELIPVVDAIRKVRPDLNVIIQ